MNDASSLRAAQRPRPRSILPADMYSALVRPDRAAPPSNPPSFPVYAEPSPESIASSDAPSATAPKKKRRKTLNAFFFFSQHVREHLPKEHQDKFRLRFDFTRFASCLWNRLSEETVEEWYARRDTAEDRCREETGHDLVGNGTDYLVDLTWRELVPEDVEKAAIYAFDHPDPAEVAKKQERKERKRKRQEERSAAAQRARESADCAPSHRRKTRRLASPATSSTLSSPDNTPPLLTPPACLSSSPLSQCTLENCLGLPQDSRPCTSDGRLYEAAATLQAAAAGTDANIHHVYENSAYPSGFVYEDAFTLPHVDRQSEPSLCSPVPRFEPHAVLQADAAYHHPTSDDHAFGSPNFDYEFTFAPESLRASLGMEASTSPVTYGYSADPVHCFLAQPLLYGEPQASQVANSVSHPPLGDAVYHPLLDAYDAVLFASNSASSCDWQPLTMETACGQTSALDGYQAHDLATYFAMVQMVTPHKLMHPSSHQL